MIFQLHVIWVTRLRQSGTYIYRGNNSKLIPFTNFEGWRMTYPVALLSDLFVGWQKVADRYNIPIYVFQTGDAYQAVSNEAQGVGCLVNTLAPQVLVSEQVARSESTTIID
jgi:hypothetical protein